MEISETTYQANGWEKARRIVMVRQEIEKRPKAAGKQIKQLELDEAKEAILGAAGIFNRLPSDGLGCSMEQRKETFSLAAEILTKLGLADQAAIYSNKV